MLDQESTTPPGYVSEHYFADTDADVKKENTSPNKTLDLSGLQDIKLIKTPDHSLTIDSFQDNKKVNNKNNQNNDDIKNIQTACSLEDFFKKSLYAVLVTIFLTFSIGFALTGSNDIRHGNPGNIPSYFMTAFPIAMIFVLIIIASCICWNITCPLYQANVNEHNSNNISYCFAVVVAIVSTVAIIGWSILLFGLSWQGVNAISNYAISNKLNLYDSYSKWPIVFIFGYIESSIVLTILMMYMPNQFPMVVNNYFSFFDNFDRRLSYIFGYRSFMHVFVLLLITPILAVYPMAKISHALFSYIFSLR